MKFEVTDKALAAKVASLIREETAKAKKRNRIFRQSYKKRLALFLEQFYSLRECKTIGFVTWYGATGSSFSPDYAEGMRLNIEWARRRTIDFRLTFSGRDLEKYFKAGEDLPCIMPGSLKAMCGREWIKTHGGAQYDVPLRVIERWLRRTRFTCLSAHEWHKLLWSEEGRAFVQRVRDKWDPGNGSYKDHLNDALCGFLYEPPDSEFSVVIVNGAKKRVYNKSLAIMRDMWATYGKFVKVEKQIEWKMAA